MVVAVVVFVHVVTIFVFVIILRLLAPPATAAGVGAALEEEAPEIPLPPGRPMGAQCSLMSFVQLKQQIVLLQWGADKEFMDFVFVNLGVF